jgi:hypothetical protein
VSLSLAATLLRHLRAWLIGGCLSIAGVLDTACGRAAQNQRESPAAREMPPKDNLGDSLTLDEARAAIRSLVAEPTCSSVTECRALPFGAKPCGGPWQYLIFSTTKTDSARLASALARYHELDARRNQRLGTSSDCAVVSRPALACALERCVAAPASDEKRKP